jgi:hypothetical protein
MRKRMKTVTLYRESIEDGNSSSGGRQKSRSGAPFLRRGDFCVIVMDRDKGMRQGGTYMAKRRKRRKSGSNSGPTKPKFQYSQGRSFSQKVFLVLGILIAVSMVLSLFVMNAPIG